MTKAMVDAQYKQVKESYKLTLIKMTQCIEVPVDQYLRSGIALKLMYALWFTYTLISDSFSSMGFCSADVHRWLSSSASRSVATRLLSDSYISTDLLFQLFDSYVLVRCSHTPLLDGHMLLVVRRRRKCTEEKEPGPDPR